MFATIESKNGHTDVEARADELETTRHDLAEAMSCPPAVAEKLRPTVIASFGAAIAGTGDPDEQRRLALMRDYYTYDAFGRPGDPAPKGTVFIAPSRIMNPDEREGICSICINNAASKLGLNDIHTAVYADRQARSDQITQATERHLASLPIYSLIESLGESSSNTSHNGGYHESMEATIRRYVEEKHRTSIHNSQDPGPAAKKEYLRRVLMLDGDESRVVSNRPGEGRSSTSIARKRAEDLIRLGRKETTAAETLLQDAKTSDPMITSEIDSYGYYIWTPLSGALESALDNLDLVNASSFFDRSLSVKLLRCFTNILFDARLRDLQYGELLSMAVKQAAKHEAAGYALGDSRHSYTLRLPSNQEALVSSGDLNDAAKAHMQWHREQDDHDEEPTEYVDFVPAEELERRRAHVIGRVFGTDDHKARIIQVLPTAQLRPFSTAGASRDLAVELYDDWLKGRPHIPGYILTSAEKTNRGWTLIFSADPAGDPYAKAHMPLPEDKRLGLAQKCEDIGFRTLADALRNAGPMSVAQAVQLLAGETYYPAVKARDRRKLPPPFIPKTLDDFAQLVHDKQLWAHCNGSAPFLELALRFCGLDAGTTVGNLIEFSHSSIREAPHMQTYLNYAGKRYILDATGTAASAELLRSVASSNGSLSDDDLDIPRSIGRRLKAPPISHTPEVLQPEQAKRVPESRFNIRTLDELTHRLRQISESIEAAIMPMLSAKTKDELWSTIAGRGTIESQFQGGDPLVGTLRLARRGSQGLINEDDLLHLAGIINAYSHGVGQTAKATGFSYYSPARLGLLGDTVQRMRAAIADAKMNGVALPKTSRQYTTYEERHGSPSRDFQ